MIAPAVGGLLALLIERLLEPATGWPWRRPPAALALHFGVWCLFSAALLAVVQRPFFTSAVWLAGFLFVVLVSNAKYMALREPFIFQDFEYFADALRHPRLYLPFLGLGRAVLAVAVLIAAVWAGLAAERSLLEERSGNDFRTLLALQALFAGGLLWLGARRRLLISFDPVTDMQRLGLLAAMWRYGEEEMADNSIASRFRVPAENEAAPTGSGHLVVVQSESFFDARRLAASIRPDVLREFDDLLADAQVGGRLAVAAWGANTVRTEFAFLSGLANDSLGIHRFNPYRRLAKQGIVSLARVLRCHGYHTVCVHPYARSFYGRDKVFPELGFDEFIDLRQFAETDRHGPYIGDLAVAERVCSLLRNPAARPLFVFVITMENHGPLHLEKVDTGEVERFYHLPPPPGCEDLTIYLRHLANANRMAGLLRETLATLPGAGCLCWYGDHVPIMPAVYQRLGEPDGRTDYLIWRKTGDPPARTRQDLAVEDLGARLLREIGLSAAVK